MLLCAAFLALPPAGALAQVSPDGKDSQKDLTKLSIEELMDIKIDTVFGASKFQQKVTEAPASITIITADEIAKYGYRTLADVLRSVPGFYITNDRNYTYAGADGISRPTDYNTHLLILVDGHRINDNIFNGAYVSTEAMVDIDLIQRIEIIRGPGSSLYGTDAFLGVINIVTKKGRDINGAEVSADAGSLGTYRERSTFGRQFANGFEILASQTYYDSGGNRRLFFPEFDAPATNNGIAQNADQDRFQSTFLSAGYKDFTLRSGYVSREKHIPTASFGTVFNDSRTKTTDSRAYIDLQYVHPIGHGWDLNARTFYDWYWYDGLFVFDYAGAGVPPFTVNNDYESGNWWGFDVSASKLLGERHRLTLGTEEDFNTKQVLGNNDIDPYFSYLFHQTSSTQSAAYIEDEYSIRSNVLLSAGARFDHYSTFGSTVNPRVALILSPQESTRIKVLYGQAFRAPDDYELNYKGTGFESNPSLQPETIKTTQLIFEKYFRRNLSVSASGFYNRINALISQETDPATNAIRYVNFNDVRGKGMEFSATIKRPSGWEGRLSYTVQEAHTVSGSAALSDSPRHLAKLNLIAPLFQQKLFAGIEAQEVSRRATVTGSEVGGFFTANATLSSKDLFGRFRASASLYNLFDKRYADPVGQEFVQPAIVQDGRTFRVKLTYRLW